MGNARKAALTVLEKCRRAGAWSDAALGGALDAAKLDARDRGLATALCYGVQQNALLLDYVLERHSSRPMKKIEPKVADILRVSAFQILFLDKIPPAAAVSEGVALCRELGYARAAGFVNAVLRRVAEQPALPPELAEKTPEALSLRYSHPLWLTGYLLSALGAEEAEAFLRLDNLPAPAKLQANTLKTTAESLAALLAREGVETERDGTAPDCLTAENPGELARLESFRAGLFYVQDPAAKLAVLAAAPAPGERIFDACAAPGGKSFAAVIAAGGGAEIIACDKHENKLRRVREGAARLGIAENLRTLAADAREFRPEWEDAFDLVIADVPCSGLGVIRKKPDIRGKDPRDFDALPEIQYAVLSNVSRYVRPGGRLLYSTCTIRSEENAAVASRFLSEHPAYAPAEFTLPSGEESAGGMMQLWPQRHGTDGFFIALMRKTL